MVSAEAYRPWADTNNEAGRVRYRPYCGRHLPVAIVVSVIHDPPTAIITILVSTGAELAILIPFTYRHARRTRE